MRSFGQSSPFVRRWRQRWQTLAPRRRCRPLDRDGLSHPRSDRGPLRRVRLENPDGFFDHRDCVRREAERWPFRPSIGVHSPRPASLAPGDNIRVRRKRSDASRSAVVIDVRASETVSTGRVVVVRWQDDHTIARSSLAPRLRSSRRTSRERPAVPCRAGRSARQEHRQVDHRP